MQHEIRIDNYKPGDSILIHTEPEKPSIMDTFMSIVDMMGATVLHQEAYSATHDQLTVDMNLGEPDGKVTLGMFAVIPDGTTVMRYGYQYLVEVDEPDDTRIVSCIRANHYGVKPGEDLRFVVAVKEPFGSLVGGYWEGGAYVSVDFPSSQYCNESGDHVSVASITAPKGQLILRIEGVGHTPIITVSESAQDDACAMVLSSAVALALGSNDSDGGVL